MVKDILIPVGKMDGDSLPVSAFVDHVDGQFELGASAYEKRGVAVTVPDWDADEVHPVQQLRLRLPARHHPSLRSDRGRGRRPLPRPPRSCPSRPARARAFTSTPWPSPRWTAWAAASASASARPSALTMVPQESQLPSRTSSTTCVAKVSEKKDMQDNTVKGSQFKQPLLEFSGSCAGCAETSLRPPRDPAVRRPDVYLQRHRLLLHLGRPGRDLSLLPPTRKATAPLGPTPCSRTTPSTASACTLGQDAIRKQPGRRRSS